MEQSPSWEANNFSASQEIPRISWNLKVHYGIHKRPAPVPVLRQTNTVQPPHTTSCRFVLILTSHLRLGLSNCLFPSSVPYQYRVCTSSSPHTCQMPRLSILLDLAPSSLFPRICMTRFAWCCNSPQGSTNQQLICHSSTAAVHKCLVPQCTSNGAN
jgi:hypothetical protein